MRQKSFSFFLIFSLLFLARPTFVFGQAALDPDIMSLPESSNPEENQSAAPTNHFQEPVSEERTKEYCDLQKAQRQQACKESVATNLPENEKAIKRSKCEIDAQAFYSQCMENVVDKGTVEKNDEVGYEIPSGAAAELNQFQGLTLKQAIGNVISTVMKIMGSLAFAIMVFAGLMWMTAAGNSDREGKAREMMLWASLGVIVILSSYSLVKFIFDAFA